MLEHEDHDIVIRGSHDRQDGAVFSPCERYRYVLWRTFQPSLFDGGRKERACVFLMLNPSTADHRVDDPTVKRCIMFAKRWHFETLYVLNLFAFRATSPADMKASEHPVGELNDGFIENFVSEASMTILAFGNHGRHQGRHKFINKLPQDRLFYFVKNKAGGIPADEYLPKHPLYVTKDADLFRWSNDEMITLNEIRCL